jgi:uncharacterized protein YjiS (DUF1127 family)
VLAPGGTVLLLKPFAHEHVKDNLSPVAQLYYVASTMICCAHAISEGGNIVLGAQVGEARLADVFRNAGFTHFRRAAETPYNLISRCGDNACTSLADRERTRRMRKTIADVVLATVAAMRTRRQTRRNARMFQHISDAQLADIGLKRSDIWHLY